MHDSLLRLTGRSLLEEALAHRPDLAGDPVAAAFAAPFALLSHDTSPDPVFVYGNRTALELFEMTWAEFTSLPSRLSAEPAGREERADLLRRVSEDGYIADYAGVRISASGRRFTIRDAVVWNLTDASGIYRGQAAMFDRWEPLQ